MATPEKLTKSHFDPYINALSTSTSPSLDAYVKTNISSISPSLVELAPMYLNLGMGSSDDSLSNILGIATIAGLSIADGLNLINAYNQYKEKKRIQEGMQGIQNTIQGRAATMDRYNTIMQNKAKADLERFNRISAMQSLAPTTEEPANTLQSVSNVRNRNNNKFFLGGMAGAAVQAALAVDKAAGTMIGGGYSSGAGKALSSLPGGGIVGGVVNRLFGSKVDEVEKARVAADSSMLKNSALAASTATDFDSAALQGPSAFKSNVNIYKGSGFASRGAKKKNMLEAEKLRNEASFAQRAAENAVSNISNDLLNSALLMTFAYGGYLNPQMHFAAPFLANPYAQGGMMQLSADMGMEGQEIEPSMENEEDQQIISEEHLKRLDKKSKRLKKEYRDRARQVSEEMQEEDPSIEEQQLNIEDDLQEESEREYEEGKTYTMSKEEYERLLEEGYELKIIKK